MKSHSFEACYLVPHGWVVLTPWIKTLDGCDYRHLMETRNDKAQAHHLAQQLNNIKSY
jgi:hypothetical protein